MAPKRQYYARRCKSSVAPKYSMKPKKRNDKDIGRCRIQLHGYMWPNDGIDRISNLPQNIKVSILQRLSLHEAARTSVLSKDWRYIWAMTTRLVLDYLFFTKLTSGKDISAGQSAYSRAIDMIISGHNRPLHSFNLYVPPDLNATHAYRFIDHFLNKGIRGLELTNSNYNGDVVPARMFDCAELVELRLNSWMLKPTPNFGGFTKLTKVTLVHISIPANLSFGPQLEKLYLWNCAGVHHLGCQFTNGNNLTDLLFYACEQIDWQWLECTRKLKVFGLGLTTTSPNLKESFDLIKFLCDTPSITTLALNGYTVEVLGPVPSMLKVLAPKIAKLKDLTLINVGFQDLRQLSNCACLLRCLPNLETLWILLEPGVESLDPTILTNEQCMESLDLKGMVLDRLHAVTIKGVTADMISVLHLIKVLFASSPSLRMLSITFNASADDHLGIKGKFLQELYWCSKKSLRRLLGATVTPGGIWKFKLV